jgi:hypothetical protein
MKNDETFILYIDIIIYFFPASQIEFMTQLGIKALL